MALFGKQLIAIDLGTSNTLIYLYRKGIGLREPSIVAVKESTQEIIAYGQQARELVGRTTQEYQVIHPVKEGVIDNLPMTKQMLSHYIKTALRAERTRCEAVISVPHNITKVERKALIDCLREMGMHRAMIVDEIFVSALGMGLAIQEPRGVMAVNIGGGTISAGVLSFNEVIQAVTIPSGGLMMDQLIIDAIRQVHNLIISDSDAEQLKIELGAAILEDFDVNEKRSIAGLSVASGVPSTATINGKLIYEAIEPITQQIILAIKQVLENLQPELASDILENGIYLTGGVSMLKRLNERIKSEIGVPVYLSDQPYDDVVNGTGKLLDDLRHEAKRVERSMR